MRNRQSAYSTLTAALLRVATRPAVLAERTRVGIDLERAPDEVLVAYLRSLLADDVLCEAVALSSTSLARVLARVDRGDEVARPKLERAVISLTKYALRMSTRPTPFGLYAGVALGTLGDDVALRIGDGHAKGVRPDSAWLDALVRRWERDVAVRCQLRVVANELCAVRGHKLVLAERPARVATGRYGSTSGVTVAYTPPVELAMRSARHPVGYVELRELLEARFGVAATRADALLGRLVEEDLLLTDLRPPLEDRDTVGHVRAILERVAHPDAAELARIEAAAERYAVAPPGRGLEELNRLVETMSALHASDHPPVQVDLRLDVEATLSSEVPAEAAHAADVLLRLAPDVASQHAHLRDYHARFLEKYGVGRLVPLPELLDPALGLGVPGYRDPGRPRVSARDEHLVRLACAAQRDGFADLVLDDDLVDRITGGSAPAQPSPSVDMSFHVLAPSAAALSAGKFRLWLSHFGASSGAGAVFGRFAYLFDDWSAWAEAMRLPTEDGVIQAQARFRTMNPRGMNVLRLPTVADHTLAVGTMPAVGDTSLGLRDLGVAATRERLHLLLRSDGREVVVTTLSTMALARTAPAAVALVRDIARDGLDRAQPWSWGLAETLPWLPRVRHGRTTLAPARWLPDEELHRAIPWPQWRARLERWRARWHVPRRISAAVLDRRLDLDLDAELHQQIFRRELRGHPALVVTETPPSGAGDLGWSAGHVAEVVVPLRATTPAPPVRPARESTAVRHFPGGEWLYVRIYVSPECQNDVLAMVPAVLGRVGVVRRWFYVRYRDPEPHLRIRVNGDPRRLAADLLPALHELMTALAGQRLAARLEIATYEPETARFGDGEGTSAAERVFAADSLCALRQLGLVSPALPAPVLAAANYLDILRSSGRPDWTQWTLDTFPRRRPGATGRDDMVSGLFELTEGGPGDPVAEGLLRSFGERRPSIESYGRYLATLESDTARDRLLQSLLHLHFNRLVGDLTGTLEEESLAIARQAVVSHRARARAAR